MVETRGRCLQNARFGYVVLAFATVSVYYLVFILGWMRILDAWGIQIPYRVALQAEMVSMLAKYMPGGVWTPAARAVALRRGANVTDTPTVLASILVEAALSAISGVIVFVISLAWVRRSRRAALGADRIRDRCSRRSSIRASSGPLSQRILKPFGAHELEPLPFPTALGLLLFYCGTWLIGGFARLVHAAQPRRVAGIATVPFLGGVSAVGAIVAVLAFFAPSGLGAREASMYGCCSQSRAQARRWA